MPTAASQPTVTVTGDTPVDDLRITPEQWFVERVRPLIAFATGGDWLPATLLPDQDELARVKQRLLRAEGAPTPGRADLAGRLARRLRRFGDHGWRRARRRPRARRSARCAARPAPHRGLALRRREDDHRQAPKLVARGAA
jgi:hypothetical protein